MIGEKKMKLQTILESIHAKNITNIFTKLVDESFEIAQKNTPPFEQDEDGIYMDDPSFYIMDLIDNMFNVLKLKVRHELNIDLRFMRHTAQGFIHHFHPQYLWLTNVLYGKLKQQIINDSMQLDNAKEMLIEVLVHEYTHILQIKNNSKLKRKVSYFENPDEIDAFVSGWYKTVNKQLGDKFDAQKFLKIMYDVFEKFTPNRSQEETNVFDELSPSARKKYLKKMYKALTSNHTDSYSEQYSVGDEVYVYNGNRPYYLPFKAIIKEIKKDSFVVYCMYEDESYNEQYEVEKWCVTRKFNKRIVKDNTNIPHIHNINDYLSGEQDEFKYSK